MSTTEALECSARASTAAAPALDFTSKVRLLTQLLETRMQTICTGFGITPGEFDVLCAIGADALPVTPKVLLGRLSISPAGLSNRLYRLELKGLVRRTTTEDDKRRMPVALTAEGRDRVQAARKLCEQAESDVLSTVGHDVGDRIEHAVAQLGSKSRAAVPAQRRSASSEAMAGASDGRSGTPWPETGRELEKLQCRLAGAVENVTPWAWDGKADQRNVCGIFVSYGTAPKQPERGTLVSAAAVVMRGNEMVATSMGARWLGFPYRPSYLGLVVGPLMEDIVHALRVPPSVFFVNGTGRDHARGAGVAIQLGAAFNVPTIGITNRPILAVGPEPPSVVGSWAPLEVDGRVVACRVRTATAGRPVTLHAGWRTSPEVARDCASSIDSGVALPRPMVRACHLARALRGEFLAKPTNDRSKMTAVPG